MDTRKVIGEGSYGCVHKPSIQCITPPKTNFNYDDYVSKIMLDKHAQDELAEFTIIQDADPTNMYHLEKPIICKPKLNNKEITDVNKCVNIKYDASKNYSLLLSKFGGTDLSQFVRNDLANYFKTDKENRITNFLLEFHHLIKGLGVFRTNDIVHYDII